MARPAPYHDHFNSSSSTSLTASNCPKSQTFCGSEFLGFLGFSGFGVGGPSHNSHDSCSRHASHDSHNPCNSYGHGVLVGGTINSDVSFNSSNSAIFSNSARYHYSNSVNVSVYIVLRFRLFLRSRPVFRFLLTYRSTLIRIMRCVR